MMSYNRRFIRQYLLISYLLLIGSACFAAESIRVKSITNRIKPVGNVHLEEASGASLTTNAIPKEIPSATPTKGQTIYEKYCAICHSSGLAGAPRFRDSTDWETRLKDRNIAALISSAIQGKNAMPAKGTCMECQDEDIKNAIQYMLPHYDKK
jgi:cytochrome c5